MKKKWLLISAGLLVILGAIVLFWNRSQPFQSVEVKLGDISEAIYGLGTVTANQTYQVKIGINTTVEKLYIVEGEKVRKGQALVRLNGSGIFRAPFDGTVTSVAVKTGELAYPLVPIVTMMNLKDRFVLVSLEQESAMRVATGQEARISFESLRGQFYTGTVHTIYPGEGQFLVRIDFSDLPSQVMPGMTGDVAIEVARKKDVILVPVGAIQMGRVLLQNGHFYKKVPVTIGAVDGRWAEVTSGNLKPGENVAISQR